VIEEAPEQGVVDSVCVWEPGGDGVTRIPLAPNAAAQDRVSDSSAPSRGQPPVRPAPHRGCGARDVHDGADPVRSLRRTAGRQKRTAPRHVDVERLVECFFLSPVRVWLPPCVFPPC